MDNLKRLLQRNDMRKLIPYMTKRMVLLPVLWLIATSSVFGAIELKLPKPRGEEVTRPNKSSEKPVPHDEKAIDEAKSYEELFRTYDFEQLRTAQREINKLPRGEQNEIREFMRPRIRDFLNRRMQLLEERIQDEERNRKQPCNFRELLLTLLSDLADHAAKELLPDTIEDGVEIASNPKLANSIGLTFAINVLKETAHAFADAVANGVEICFAWPRAITSTLKVAANHMVDDTVDNTFPKTAT